MHAPVLFPALLLHRIGNPFMPASQSLKEKRGCPPVCVAQPPMLLAVPPTGGLPRREEGGGGVLFEWHWEEKTGRPAGKAEGHAGRKKALGGEVCRWEWPAPAQPSFELSPHQT